MDEKFSKFGYELLPSKYTPALGYSGLKVVISGHPTQRYFDVKALNVPTFDGRYYHKSQVYRYELQPKESFQVCLGQFSLETFRGEHIHAFSFGGVLRAEVSEGDQYCELTSSAPIFKLQDDPDSVSGVIASEILDILAEIEVKLAHHEDELYARLAKVEPYQVFIACLKSMQKRAEHVPTSLHTGSFHKVATNIQRAIKIVQDAGGWDDRAPNLEDLLAAGP